MYQLVIIGASPEGLTAAHSCVGQYAMARIALITQGWEQGWSGDHHGDLGEENFWEELRLLAAQGVDVVVGQGIFSQSSGLLCQTQERTLEGKAIYSPAAKPILKIRMSLPFLVRIRIRQCLKDGSSWAHCQKIWFLPRS
ncbi:hypothetical protein NON20_10260 [Synechocystis sp. B12]|nr:hypothetical protein NON20_10260 [Synechocystis sp. B12]